MTSEQYITELNGRLLFAATKVSPRGNSTYLNAVDRLSRFSAVSESVSEIEGTFEDLILLLRRYTEFELKQDKVATLSMLLRRIDDSERHIRSEWCSW